MFTDVMRHDQAVPSRENNFHIGKRAHSLGQGLFVSKAKSLRKEENVDNRDVCNGKSGITETVMMTGPYSSGLPKLYASQGCIRTQCEWLPMRYPDLFL